MAQLVDTSVFITLERNKMVLDFLGHDSPEDAVAIAAVTASELLAGIHLADTAQRRTQRESFVEKVLSVFPVVPFDLRVARIYARLMAELRGSGQPVGTHDLQIAATAFAAGFEVLTHNLRDFTRVPGLPVRHFHLER